MTNFPDPGTDGRMLTFLEWTRGGVVFDADVALRLAEVLLLAHHDAAELERQRPLIVSDKGTYWQIDGSWNRDRDKEGIFGPFFCRINKFDGRILNFGLWGVIHPHPDAVRMIQEAMRRKKDGGES